MQNLILSTLQDYLLTGVVISLLINLPLLLIKYIQCTAKNECLTLGEFTVSIVIWPFIVFHLVKKSITK
jgi:hypothetical protein